MAKKLLKKAQPGLTVGQTNVDLANQAALEKVKAPAIKPYDMDTMYAASRALSDSTYKTNLDALKQKQQQRENAKRARLLDSITTPNKKAGGATTRPITDLGMVDRMEKAKFLKGKKK